MGKFGSRFCCKIVIVDLVSSLKEWPRAEMLCTAFCGEYG